MPRCLGDIRFGELLGGLDLLEEPPPWGGVDHVGGFGIAGAAGEHAADVATDVSDDGSRIPRGGERVRLATV